MADEDPNNPGVPDPADDPRPFDPMAPAEDPVPAEPLADPAPVDPVPGGPPPAVVIPTLDDVVDPAPVVPVPADPGVATPTLNDVVDAESTAPAAQPGADGTGTGNGTTATSVVDAPFSQTQRDLAFRLVWVLMGVVIVIVLLSSAFSIRCVIDPVTNSVNGAPPDPCAAVAPALVMFNQSMSPVFTAMIGLVGSVVGFYFGSKKS